MTEATAPPKIQPMQLLFIFFEWYNLSKNNSDVLNVSSFSTGVTQFRQQKGGTFCLLLENQKS